MVGGGWVVDAASLAPRDGRVSSINETLPVCFLFHTRSSRTNQLTAPRVPGVLLYVLLHCCIAVVYVVEVWSVGGWWVHCVVRGRWVGRFVRGSLFFVLSEIPLSLCFQNTGLPLVLGSTTVSTAALLCPLLPYVLLLHCRAAALLLFYIIVFQGRQP